MIKGVLHLMHLQWGTVHALQAHCQQGAELCSGSSEYPLHGTVCPLHFEQGHVKQVSLMLAILYRELQIETMTVPVPVSRTQQLLNILKPSGVQTLNLSQLCQIRSHPSLRKLKKKPVPRQVLDSTLIFKNLSVFTVGNLTMGFKQ